MMRTTGLSIPLIRLNRTYFLIYVMLIIFTTFSLADINKHNKDQVSYMKMGFNSIENSKESTDFQHEGDKIDGSRNHTVDESVTINGGKNSAALNKFLEDVLMARDDFKWIDRAVHRANHRARPENLRTYANKRIAESVNSAEDIHAGQLGIGYGSRLRGKRGFDRNYETMWMPRKEQYEDEGAGNVPQRVYLDNDVTFKRDANGVDFHALYGPHGMLDRAIYEGEARVDQPLKDKTAKKDLHSSGERSNSNEKLEVADGADPPRHDYGSVHEVLVNSDSKRDGADVRASSEIASLWNEHVDDFTMLRESPAAMKNAGKFRNAPLSLESLKRRVLELRNSLMLSDKRENIMSPKASLEESYWWDDPRLTAEALDLEKSDLHDRPFEGTARKTEIARNTGDENESGLSNLSGTRSARFYFGERNEKELHDRSKRSRRSFLADASNQTMIVRNETIRPVRVTKNILENITETRSLGYNTSSKGIKQSAETGAEIPGNIERTAMGHADSSDFQRNIIISNNPINSTNLPINNGDDNVPRGFEARQSTGRELEAAAWKVSRLGTNDGQSKGVQDESPWGNTSPRHFDKSAARAEIAKAKAGTNETQKEGRESTLLGVIKVSEARGRLYEKRVAEATIGLSAANMRTSNVDESTGNANAKAVSSSGLSIDPVGDTRTEAATADMFSVGGSIQPSDRLDDLASIIVDNDLREQQMISPFPPAAASGNANKSDGNSDRAEIDIRAFGSRNGNEAMNVKDDIRTTIVKAGETDNNLQRKLLWIVTTTAEPQSKAITTGSSIPGEIKKNEDSAEKDSTLQADINFLASEKNRYARYKRSAYFSLGENLESDNEADSENLAIEKEAAINPDEKEEDSNEEYLNQNVDELAGNYNDADENAENDEVSEDERQERSLSTNREINPIQARVNMLIKQRLDMKNKERSSYSRKKRNTLNVIEYYDYDGDEEKRETRDALVNEQKVENNDERLPIEDSAKIKRDDAVDGKAQSCSWTRPPSLGKKKNENAEAVMKEERRKERLKNKEPKEEFIVDLGKSKNKTARSGGNDRELSGSSASLESTFNEREQLMAKENPGKIRENEDIASSAYHEESMDTKSKWLNGLSENGMASPKNSETPSRDGYDKRVSLDESLKYLPNTDVDVNSENIIENIVLDIQPLKILEQSKELEAKDVYEDFENEHPEDYYYHDNDRGQSNDVEPAMYEELKKMYDWSDGELKSGPRLRGDQRLHYELNDKLDKKHSQLQPLNARFFDSNENDNVEMRSHDASYTNDALALKVNNMLQDGVEHSSSTEENLSNILKVIEDKSGSLSEGNAAERSVLHADSDSSYKNRGYVDSEVHDALKRDISGKQTAVISPQDLSESFVESLDWHDDLDDTAKIRLGRGLKAVDEMLIPDPRKIRDPQSKSHMMNATNANSEFRDFQRVSRNDTSRNRQNLRDNPTADLTDIFHIRHDEIDRNAEKNRQPMNIINTDDEDLEAVEQKYTNRQIPRIRRAAASYRTFYDDASPNQHDPDEADGSVGSRFQFPDIFENNVYHKYATPNEILDLNRYSKMSRSIGTGKKEKTTAKAKKKKKKKKKRPAQISGRYAPKASSQSSSGGRHHAHRSDMSKNTKRDRKSKQKKDKVQAARLNKRISSQKSEIADRRLFRAAEANEAADERVLYENAEDQNIVKPEEDDTRSKKIALLLATDNVDDETQMDMALQGELAKKIVEQIYEQVQKNEQLRSVFGPGLYRDYKMKDVIADNAYRPRFKEDGTNHTEIMMKKVMELLGRFIVNEVQRKTCVSLSPDMREFLGWMLDVDQEEESLPEEAPPLPFIRQEVIPEEETGREFLFDSTSKQEAEGNDIGDLQRKVRVLETLVKEYNALTAKEKTRVQTVHDYLLRQLNQLLRYIEARETKVKTASMPTGAARIESGDIFQYQSAIPNATSASYPSTKDALSLPVDTRDNLFRFHNTTLGTANKQLRHNFIASRRREIRSLDEMSSKRRRERKQRKNRDKPKRKRGKHSEHHDHRRVKPSSDRRKSRRKRANLEVSHPNALYLGYEEPTIYDSFDVLTAKLASKTKQRKRELADEKNVEREDANDRTLDSLPIKGKNRLEDEVILLNKREAWKRENKEQLEEVAFGRDMRNGTRRERARFEKLTEADKRKSMDEAGSRAKREDAVRAGSQTIAGADRTNHSLLLSRIDDRARSLGKEPMTKADNNSDRPSEDKLGQVERGINVFADSRTEAAIDTEDKRVGPEEGPAINVKTDNYVKDKLSAINCETKIDNSAYAVGTSSVNLTSAAKPRISTERRRKVSEAEGEADDNAVKLNRATNRQNEQIDPESELKNLRQARGDSAHDVTDSIYGDDNLSGNKLGEKYTAELEGPDDLDIDSRNNLQLARLRSDERPSSDVVEWRMTPIIKRSSYRDNYIPPRIVLRENETPILRVVKDTGLSPNVYLNDPVFRRLKNRRRASGIFNIAPVLKIVGEDPRIPRKFYPRTKRVSQTATLKDLRADPEILLQVQKFPRLRANERYETYPVLKAANREFHDVLRSRDDSELGDRTIYDGSTGLRIPVWPYRYYDDYMDSTSFRFVPDVLGKDGMYRYPVGAYLEYDPFKDQPRDLDRSTRRNKYRLRISEGATGFSENDLAHRSSKSRIARGESRANTNLPILANHSDHFVFDEARKYTRTTNESNETKPEERSLNNDKI